MDFEHIPLLALIFFCMYLNQSHGTPVAKLNVLPTILKQSGDTVNLTWTDIQSPSPLDWIGIYSPPESNNEHYIGYILLSSCASWTEGTCSLEVPLVNMRSGYQFRLYQGVPANISGSTPLDEDGNPLPSTATQLAVSENVGFVNYNEPTQIHLSPTSSAKEMRVMFVTKDLIGSFVKYGLERHSLSSIEASKTYTYRQSDMCHSPANSSIGWRDPGYFHDALMSRLEPRKRYFYQVGSDEGGWSNMYSFISFSTESEETNALLYGDMGTSVPYKTFLWTQAESKNTVKWLKRDIELLGDKPVFISHIGDISYARGYSWLWDEFFSQIQPLAVQVPYLVCIGNHEYDWPSQPWKPEWALKVYGTDGGGECGVPYSLRFHMPGNSSLPTGTLAPPTTNLYYSISSGVVHFIYMSTETSFFPGSDQYSFLIEDLKNVNRDRFPFVVLLGHRPMYTSENDITDEPLQEQMLKYLEPLLVQYHVNLALWGHVHKYERTCPIKNFTCIQNLTLSNPLYPIHVVIGMGGQDWQTSWTPRSDHPNYPIFPQPSWSLYRSGEFGYVRLHATKNLLTLSYVGNHDGEVHDILEISPSQKQATTSARQWPEKFITGSLFCILLVSIFCMLGYLVYGHWRTKSGIMKGSWSRIST